MKYAYAGAAALFLWTGLSATAAAQEAALEGGATTTEYSGKAHSRKAIMTKSAADNDAVFSVIMGERSDDPCYLQLRFRDVASGAESSKTFNECSGDAKSLRTISLPKGAFATGVRVCLNASGDKVKGIQLLGNYGACLLGDEFVYAERAPCSSVVKVSGHDYRLCSNPQPSYVAMECSSSMQAYYERTNCQGANNGPDGDWEETVRCPAGKVATGMKLNLRDGGGDRKMYNGIALDCHDLVED